MNNGRNDQDTERLRQFFAEVHRDDRVPSFERMARSVEGPRRHTTALRPAFAVLAVVLMAVSAAWLVPVLRGPGPLSEDQQLALARGLSSFETPLDFLLETPGRELLYAAPSFELMENLGENAP